MSADQDPYDSRLLPRDFLSRQPAAAKPPVTPRSATPPRPAEPRPVATPPAAPKTAAPAEKPQVSAVELCKRIDLSAEAKELLQEGLTPWAFVERLMGKQLHADALRVTAHALAKREAVWWACQCTKSVLGPNPAAPITAALKISATWVADPSEANRRAAQPAAETAGLTHPAGVTAMAAFFSGSLAPPDLPVVPPKETLTAEAVAGAVLLAAVLSEPQKGPERQRKFLGLGVEVAKGINKWK